MRRTELKESVTILINLFGSVMPPFEEAYPLGSKVVGLFFFFWLGAAWVKSRAERPSVSGVNRQLHVQIGCKLGIRNRKDELTKQAKGSKVVGLLVEVLHDNLMHNSINMHLHASRMTCFDGPFQELQRLSWHAHSPQ